MRKRRRVPAIILAMLMAVQTPAMAGELMVEEEAPVVEEIAAEGVVEEELPEEVVIEEQEGEEVAEEIITEEDVLDNGDLEEPMEDSLIPEEIFEEELVAEPIETITEEVPAEGIGDAPSEEGISEEDELTVVGANSGKCGKFVNWTMSDNGVLTISGYGDMYNFYPYDRPFTVSIPITEIIIEPGVTSLGDYAFSVFNSLYFRYLKSVTIPNTITRIGKYTFSHCESLTSVAIPDSVTIIDEGAFYGCASLKNMTIPRTITIIAKETFSCCHALTSVTIPNNITRIGEKAFQGCSSLKKVIIGKGVKGIVSNAFNDCSSLTEFSVHVNNNTFSAVGGILFNKDQSGIIRCPGGKTGAYNIPNSVKRVDSCAFQGCSALTSVSIPDGVTNIGQWAFSGCTSITSIIIPGSVREIGNGAFGDCSSLKNIYFSGDAPKFGNNNNLFNNIIATAYYPSRNPTWAPIVKTFYGGLITWIQQFIDVTNPDDFFYDPIYWAVVNGITTGYKDNTFRPRNNCNRAAVVTFLWRLAGKPDEGISTAFSDMTGNDDFDHAITWAANHGITTGYNDGTFRPWDTCHRAAIVTFIWRYAGRPEPTSMANFSDMTGNDDFNKAISWASEKGITTGYTDGTFRPYNQCLRLAVATFLYRYAHL